MQEESMECVCSSSTLLFIHLSTRSRSGLILSVSTVIFLEQAHAFASSCFSIFF